MKLVTGVAAMVCAGSVTLSAQWLKYPTAEVPRLGGAVSYGCTPCATGRGLVQELARDTLDDGLAFIDLG